jgi:Na+/H+ antiporter NhaD/arsenite permease-like protein
MFLAITSELLPVSIFSGIPFLLMLACIAIFPLFFNHFWEKNSNKLLVAGILSIPIIIYLAMLGNYGKLYETMVFDYLPFLVLLGALFIITGGIYIDGDIEAKPIVNTVYLAIGAILASFIGTTGAAMLLIRPIISTNSERKYRVHTILFFIGIVANCGGLMTPLGDPPLFVLYLRGTPFFWFFNLASAWLFVNTILLLAYYLLDRYYHKKEPKENLVFDHTNIKPIAIKGNINFVWLLGVVCSVAFINEQFLPFIGKNEYFKFLREILIVGFAVASLKSTQKTVRISNNFSWAPIVEVAFLFFGIFITMVPCIIYLELNAQTLGVTSPMQFYFTSGFLSSFLDNTPTAVTFHSLAIGLQSASAVTSNLVAGIPVSLLKAISLGSVLFGSMTYIGNGPNFMVKSIAEENGIAMPHFFKYMYGFSLLFLLPTFILVYFFFV